jgi:hypothetical protein
VVVPLVFRGRSSLDSPALPEGIEENSDLFLRNQYSGVVFIFRPSTNSPTTLPLLPSVQTLPLLPYVERRMLHLVTSL